jgi:hypothetical protein
VSFSVVPKSEVLPILQSMPSSSTASVGTLLTQTSSNMSSHSALRLVTPSNFVHLNDLSARMSLLFQVDIATELELVSISFARLRANSGTTSSSATTQKSCPYTTAGDGNCLVDQFIDGRHSNV